MKILKMIKFLFILGITILVLVLICTAYPVLATITCTVSVNSAISDLSAGQTKTDSIELTWTTPNIRSISHARFDVRYSRTIIFPENWDQAIPILGEPKPKAGADQKMKVKDLERNTVYYFALKVVGMPEGDSPMSNLAMATTLDKNSNRAPRIATYFKLLMEKLRFYQKLH